MSTRSHERSKQPMPVRYLATITTASRQNPLRTPQHAASFTAGVLLALVAMLLLVAPAAHAEPFGLKDFDVTFTEAPPAGSEPGTPGPVDTQAGSHPFAMDTYFELNTAEGLPAGGELKDDFFEQVPGFVGDATAIPQCSNAAFAVTGAPFPDCPRATQIGVVAAQIGFFKSWEPEPVYNLTPPPGVPARIGFRVTNAEVIIDVGVKDSSPYSVLGFQSDVPQTVTVFGARLQLWGNPADPRHNPFRVEYEGSASQGAQNAVCGEQTSLVRPSGIDVNEVEFKPGTGCSSPSSDPKPFLTLPRSCSGPALSSYAVDSWSDPGSYLPDGSPDLSDPAWVSGSALTHDSAEPPLPQGFTGCAKLGFHPGISAAPTSRATTSPTGLDFHLNVADEGLTNPGGLAQSDIKKAVVTLPEGMTANPSLAEGLNVCTEEDLKRETASSLPGEGCPEASKLGTVEVETPLLPEPLKGSLFIAKPHENPFGSLLALYFVIKNPQLGISIKQAAKVEPNPTTGQLVTITENIPQLPFSHFKLHFREGARSPLITPSACGTYDAKAELTPWSGGEPITTSSMFQIISGPDDGPCPPPGIPAFNPQISAGMLNNNAGAFSPFDLRLTGRDGEPEISSFSTSMPPGLTGVLTGIPFCPDADVELARSKTGVQEQNEPSCPAASQLGHSIVGTGVGSALAYTPGKIYLAGPFHGDPFSLVSVTSAVVGPFDLGTVVIRFGLRIDPRTAQVNVDPSGSEPIPTILQGIVTHVRDIHVYIDRPNFTLNPTSCEPTAISSTLSSDLAQTATISSRFQAANCANLKFTPKVTVTAPGAASKANGEALSFRIEYPKNAIGTQSWFNEAKFTIPKQLPARLTTIQQACLATTFETNRGACPPHSIIGHAVVHTPVLPVPLEGPVYFVSYGGAAFPDAVLVLDGYGVHIELHGKTHIDGKTGVTTATFLNTPDVPFESIEVTLPTGPYSEFGTNLGGSYDFCGHKLIMPTFFKASNGLEINQNTQVAITGCPTKAAISSRKVNGHNITLSVYVPGAGKLTVAGKSLSSATKTATGIETLTVTIHSKHTGRAKRHVQVLFTPTHGPKQTLKITLRA